MVAFAQQMQQVGAVLDTAAPAMVHSARVAFQRAISALVPTAAPVVTDLGIDAAVQTLPMPEVSELSYVFDPKGPGMRESLPRFKEDVWNPLEASYGIPERRENENARRKNVERGAFDAPWMSQRSEQPLMGDFHREPERRPLVPAMAFLSAPPSMKK